MTNQLDRAELRKLRYYFLSAIPPRRTKKIFNQCVYPKNEAYRKHKIHKKKSSARNSEITVHEGSPMNMISNERIFKETQVTDIVLKFSILELDWRSRLGKRRVVRRLGQMIRRYAEGSSLRDLCVLRWW